MDLHDNEHTDAESQKFCSLLLHTFTHLQTSFNHYIAIFFLIAYDLYLQSRVGWVIKKTESVVVKLLFH